MLSDKDFIDKVWSKYEVYANKQEIKKDKFFIGKLYKNAHNMLILKTCALFMLVIAVTTLIGGGTYAGVKYVVEKEEYNEIRLDEEGYRISYFSGKIDNINGFDSQDEIRYKKIDNYEEYIKFYQEFSDIPEMTENDFKEYFLLIILSSANRKGLYIDNMGNTEDTLKINIRSDNGDNFIDICTKVSKNMEREKIEIIYLENKPNMSNYINLNNVPHNYTKEQAIKDGCIVLDNGKFLTDPDGIKNFMKKTENGVNDNIRIAQYNTYIFLSGHEKNENGAIILDIEFKDGKYIVCEDYSRTFSEHENGKECSCIDENFKELGHKYYFISTQKIEYISEWKENGKMRFCFGDGSLADEEYILYETCENPLITGIRTILVKH